MIEMNSCDIIILIKIARIRQRQEGEERGGRIVVIMMMYGDDDVTFL